MISDTTVPIAFCMSAVFSFLGQLPVSAAAWTNGRASGSCVTAGSWARSPRVGIWPDALKLMSPASFESHAVLMYSHARSGFCVVPPMPMASPPGKTRLPCDPAG